MTSEPEAVWIIHNHQADIRKAAHLPPADKELISAFAAIKQPARVHVQALAGLGGLLPLQGPETTPEQYHARLHNAPFQDRFETIKKALLSNIFLELPSPIAQVFIQEASEALESVPARLVSTKQVKAARRVHIVTGDGSQRVFLRAVEYGGEVSSLEIQSNFTGAAIERDPIGTLSRATLSWCGWRLEPGWLIVQPAGGYRAGTAEMGRLRSPSPILNREPPQTREETPESSLPTPKPR